MKKTKKKKAPVDRQLEEFEKKDLGDDIRRAGGGVWIVSKYQRLPTSLVLDRTLVDKLKEKAAKRGLGYQTFLKMIVYENIDKY